MKNKIGEAVLWFLQFGPQQGCLPLTLQVTFTVEICTMVDVELFSSIHCTFLTAIRLFGSRHVNHHAGNPFCRSCCG